MQKLLLGLLVWSAFAAAKDEEFAKHPTPKQPLFLSEQSQAIFKGAMPPMPALESEQQKADEAELNALQKSRTPADCDRARAEVSVSLQTFFGKPVGPLDSKTIARLNPFFEQVRNDADYFIHALKRDLPRARPYSYILGIEPCIPREVSLAYPSGHATLAKVFARVLTDLYPKQKTVLEARAKQIGDDRVLAGVHHRSDIEAGRKLADLVYEEMV
ncbi:hypothetical protein K2X33_09970, partial [bacterium]|nr:hypothetical protein [bacterium]